MFNTFVKRVLKHIENRRKWNRTKRWMADRAQSRMIVSLYSTGALRRGA